MNMPVLRTLLPTAKICVDAREADDYRRFVPAANLLVHPPTEGAPAARNWIIANVKQPVLIQLDDDFVGVQVNVGSKRYITDSEEILAIFENAMVACNDLGVGCFCFSRTCNLTAIKPDMLPIKPTQQVYGCWGVLGSARHRLYDTSLKSRADLDWTLRTLLEDRCVYADTRFYFDFGTSFTGSGGNTGLVTPQQFLDSSREVKKRWGKSVSFKPPGYVKSRDIAVGRVMVRRVSRAAKR